MRLSAFLLFGCFIAAPAAAQSCAPTPELAVAQWLSRTQSLSAGDGYRVDAVRFDALLRRSYALVARCNAEAWPRTSVLLPASYHASEGTLTAGVHVGDNVLVIRAAGDSKLELSGVAEEAGMPGKHVRVRLPRFGDDATAPAPVIRCTVIAERVVEVNP